MKKLFLNLSIIFIFILSVIPLRSQNYWISNLNQIEVIDETPVNIYSLDDQKFKTDLRNEKHNQINLPNENNKYELFMIEEIQVLSKTLSLKYPLIRTFKGYSKKRPNVSIRITLSPKGISAWINVPGKENIFIQPDRKSKGKHYVYKRTE